MSALLSPLALPAAVLVSLRYSMLVHECHGPGPLGVHSDCKTQQSACYKQAVTLSDDRYGSGALTVHCQTSEPICNVSVQLHVLLHQIGLAYEHVTLQDWMKIVFKYNYSKLMTFVPVNMHGHDPLSTTTDLATENICYTE